MNSQSGAGCGDSSARSGRRIFGSACRYGSEYRRGRAGARMGDTLLSSRAGLISRCAGLRAHPANDIEHKMTQIVRSFGASDFRLAACGRSPASSQESWKRSAPPGIAMPMISDQTRHRAAHMKISRSAAIMNGKFESNSNDYDESNLNRLHTVHDGLTSPTASVRSSSANRARPASLQQKISMVWRGCLRLGDWC